MPVKMCFVLNLLTCRLWSNYWGWMLNTLILIVAWYALFWKTNQFYVTGITKLRILMIINIKTLHNNIWGYLWNSFFFLICLCLAFSTCKLDNLQKSFLWVWCKVLVVPPPFCLIFIIPFFRISVLSFFGFFLLH